VLRSSGLRVSAALLLVVSLATGVALTTGVETASANAPTAIEGSGQVSAQVAPTGKVTLDLSGKWSWAHMTCAQRWGIGWAVSWQDTSTPYTITGNAGNTGPGPAAGPPGPGPGGGSAPVVSAISPETGSPLGGTTVTITGQHFTTATAVDFGESAAASFRVTSPTSITAVTPGVSSTGKVRVIVTTPEGTSSVGHPASSAMFEYKGSFAVGRHFDGTDPAQPTGTLCAVTTESAGSGGGGPGGRGPGSSQALQGTWSAVHTYADAAAVPAVVCVNFYDLHGSQSHPVQGSSPTWFAGGPAPYNHDNSLQTGGFSWLIGGNCLLTPPIVTGLSQTVGPATGGTTVTIIGSGFTGAARGSVAVDFGSTPARTVRVTGSTQITATSPGGAGMVHVTVTDLGGSSPSSASSQFNYVPVVTGVSPDAGPSSGGTPVTVTGDGFTGVGAGTVHFGSVAATAVTVVSNTEITATAPAGAIASGSLASTVDVTVTDAGATSPASTADRFTYIAPAVARGLSPDVGPAAGGTTVTITGSGFTTASTVKFGTAAASNVTFSSATKITAVSPAGTGTQTVTVTTGGTASSPGAFTYAPVVTSLSTSTGPATGGTTITVTGSGFAGASAVTFGSVPARSFTVTGTAKITAVVPGGAGSVAVQVATVAGSSVVSAASTYTYAPVVASVTPATGPASGGSPVTITGFGFTGTGSATVLFGGGAAADVAVVSDTTITAVTPSASAGTVTVTVKNAGKASAPSAGSHFTYVSAPVVAGLSPDVGPAAGGTSVVITGSGFTGATEVTFGSVPATSFAVVSTTSITATSPAGRGTVTVTVVAPGGRSSTGVAFTYAPLVTGLSQSAGPATGGNSIVITGSGFTGATEVTFGSVPATSFAVVSTTSISAVVPGGAGTVHARVSNVAGSSPITAASVYSYVPVVTSVSPDAGAVGGGAPVTIAGVGFSGATAVDFGATAATGFDVVSDTEITVAAPAVTLPAGELADPVDVRVTTPGGTSPTSASDVFTYIAPAVVTGVSPEMGPATGGTTVTISGAGFIGAAHVRFGASTATSFQVTSTTKITARVPAGIGVVTVSVLNASGAASSSGTFSYVPVVSSLTRHTGPATGGTKVTISGNGFTASVVRAVDFDSTPAKTVTVVNPTTITAVAPGGAGAVDVTVTTVGGSSVPSTGGRFTYVPVVSGVSPAGGPATGGSTVTVTGAGFVAPATVTFGGVAATGVAVVNSTEITVKAPAGSGAVPVAVTSSGRTSPVAASATFTYAPVVTKVTPSTGPQAGATEVTITGVGFDGATTVKFGTVPSASFTVIGTTKIVATAPTATASGVVDVTVGNRGGSSAPSTADRYTYQPTPMPKLSLAVVATAQGVFAGNPVGLKVTVSNTGTATATGTTLVDSLPSGPTVHWSITKAPAGGAAPRCTITGADAVLSCTSVNLAAGASYTFDVGSATVSPASCGPSGSTSLTDSATLSASNVGSPVKKTTKIVVACAGTAQGSVVAPTATHPKTANLDIPVTGASVALCPTPVVFPDQTCTTTTTTRTGKYSMASLPAGTYFLEVLSLEGRVKTASPVHIYSNRTTTIARTTMPTALKRMPSTVSITTPRGTVTGTTASTPTAVKAYVPPVIPAKEPTTIHERSTCATGTATFVVQQGATTIASGALKETPPGSTTYVGSFTPGTTSIGAVVITTTFTCPGSSTKVSITFTAYIDPSGQVLDSNGQPISGATVVLYKLTTARGSFVQVPTGSAIMSQTNRKNPQVTGANGTFDWFVEVGTYQIVASYNSCTAKSQTLQVNSTNAAKSTTLTGLKLTLSCPIASGGTTRHRVTTRPGGTTSPGAGATAPGSLGYLLVSAGGGVFAFGEARFEGSLPGIHVRPLAPIVGVATLRTGGGYWLAGADGGVFSFGAAHFYGSLPERHVKPAGPVTGIAATPTGGGYWLVSSEGDVYGFGAAKSYGSPASSGAKPGSRIVGMAAAPTGKGYWLAAANGDVYAYGAATYLGGISSLRLRHPLVGPIVAIASTPTGQGYWLAGRDGGVFAFGKAAFFGNTYTAGVAKHLRGVIASITPTPDGKGYWLIGVDGGVFSFGDAPFLGNTYTDGAEPHLTGHVTGRSNSRRRA